MDLVRPSYPNIFSFSLYFVIADGHQYIWMLADASCGSVVFMWVFFSCCICAVKLLTARLKCVTGKWGISWIFSPFILDIFVDYCSALETESKMSRYYNYLTRTGMVSLSQLNFNDSSVWFMQSSDFWTDLDSWVIMLAVVKFISL